MSTKALLTIEQYEQLPDTGARTELVDGKVIELPSESLLHDWVRDEVRMALRRQGGGNALTEREFRTILGRVRRADVVWFARSLSPVPDLAVEVVSPNDLATQVRKKVREYLEAGVTTVWVVYLETREADVWNRERGVIAVSDALTADCLPGFALSLDSVFPKDI